MRALKKNTVPFWYSLYQKSEPVRDENGLLTGEKTSAYSAPVKAFANISPASSAATVQTFGIDIRYDKVIVMADPKFPMDEHSLLRLADTLETDNDGQLLADHIVVRVSRSLNSVSYAVREVKMG